MKRALAEASLIMKPEGYAEGVLPSLKPSNGDGDFTFTRGSNLSATRVNAEGLIEKGRENLLLHSNTFDTTWGTPDSNVTTGQIGYDGSNNAWLLSKTDFNGRTQQNIVTSGVKTFNIYAKAGTKNWIALRVDGSGVNTYFDLQNGVLGSSANTIEANIESVGNGWYRCSVSFSSSITRVRIYVADGNNDTSGTSGSIYIQDAQLEQGLVATDYIETGATTAKAGVLENTPRLDYSGGATEPSLLLEPQRTNLITRSEYINWDIINVSLDRNYGISPEGVKNSLKVTSLTTLGRFQTSIALPTNTDFTFSLFIKNVDSPKSQIYGVIDTMQYDISWNGAEISSVTTGLNYELFGDGWYRVWETSQSDSSSLFRIYPDRTSGVGSVEIYGLQLEEASYPTSYIPTYGTSQTRLGDLATDAGNASTFNDSEGVLYAEVKTSAPVTSAPNSLMLSINDGTNFNEVRFEFFTSNRLYASVRGADGEASAVQTITQTNYNKIAIKYTSSGCKFFVNGVGYAFDGKSISGLNAFSFSRANTTTGPFYGDVKQVLTFNTALSDSECIALTKLD